MAEKPQGNVERLEEAGLITTGSLPAPYVEVLEELDGAQVDLLIKLQKRLGKAEERHKSEAGADAKLIVECFGVPL